MVLDRRKSVCGSQQWLQFHISLLYYKMRQILLQNVTFAVIFLQNPTKCVRFLLQKATILLQNASILLQNATVITKYDVYYKMRQ